MLRYSALSFSRNILPSSVIAQAIFLMHAVRAAQQCADRGLLKFIFVSSDDAFITRMLGAHLQSQVTALHYSCSLYTSGLWLSCMNCS